ncbi:MAG: hypothetical protein MRK02_00165 [Candidatus Scalindua sp.]|nr:hypothetical protein [Candidatus Scalindua sp.]
MQKKINCERCLVINAYQRLKKNSSINIIHYEVPLLGRSIDLAYILNGKLFAVEFKLKNWRRAIRQAKDYKLGVDFAYICMPERDVSTIMRKAIEDAEVGLIFYRETGKWPFKEIIKAPKSQEIWNKANLKLKIYLENAHNL